MTNEHIDSTPTAAPEGEVTEVADTGREDIPPVTSDWTPEAGEYQISTA
ncbi:hypothetical protein [Streptomyces griseorubiginosus]